MSSNYAKNLASGTLAESISASTTTLLVYVGEGGATTIRNVWPTTPFYASIMPANPSAGVANSLDSEIVKVTAVSNDQVGNTSLTVTRAQRGTTGKAFTAGAIVTNADYAEDAVLLGDEGTTETPTPWVGTEVIENGSVTRDKLDPDTNMIVRKLDEINAANIPYNPSNYGLELDVIKYFANNSTANNRPMVFDEIKLMLDISCADASTVHYLRFGNSSNSEQVVRNMLTLGQDGTVSCSLEQSANIILAMRLGSNSEVTIKPFGGASRIPTLADELAVVTISDNSSNTFTTGNARVNLNSLYRLSLSNNKVYMFQNDTSGTLFTGKIKVYGIKYPTE